VCASCAGAAAYTGPASGGVVVGAQRRCVLWERVFDRLVLRAVGLAVAVVGTADLVVPYANVLLKVGVQSKRATAHFAHVFAQLAMHGLVVRGQVALQAEPLVAFGALKVLARLAFVNASFVVAQRPVVVEPSQTHIALRPVVAIERVLLARLLVLVLDLLLDLAQRRRFRRVIVMPGSRRFERH
jgi:hypothetical protein